LKRAQLTRARSIVCQVAKAKGLRVLASTGSSKKLAFLSSLGIDRAFNYKTSSLAQELDSFGGIDIYWDNVGGEMLDDVLLRMTVHGRVIVCGMASEYNAQEAYGVKNLLRLVYWHLTLLALSSPTCASSTAKSSTPRPRGWSSVGRSSTVRRWSRGWRGLGRRSRG